MPKVSIIIPVYNAEKYLADCLDSLKKQSYRDFEVIAVDDGSSDKTGDILAGYAQADSRFIVLHQANGGAGCARNKGLQQAAGEYICFMDADDLVHPRYLEICLRLAEQYQAKLVTCSYYSFKDSVPQWPLLDVPALDLAKSENPVLLGCHASPYAIHYTVWGKLYHKSLLEGCSFPEDQVFYEDLPFIYSVLAKKPVTVSLSAPLYAYRNAENSLTHQVSGLRHIEDCTLALKRIQQRYMAPGLEEEKQFLIQDFIPSVLKNILYRCRHSYKPVRRKMFALFGRELASLRQAGWLQKKGNSWRRFLTYQCLIQMYKRGIL